MQGLDYLGLKEVTLRVAITGLGSFPIFDLQLCRHAEDGYSQLFNTEQVHPRLPSKLAMQPRAGLPSPSTHLDTTKQKFMPKDLPKY